MPDDRLSLRLTPEDDTTVVASAAGEVDLRGADGLDDLGALLIGAGFTAVRLDLAGIRSADGAGAEAIDRLRARLVDAGLDPPDVCLTPQIVVHLPRPTLATWS